MGARTSLLWDKEAQKPETEHIRGPYLTKLFLTAIDKTLKNLPNYQETKKILKTDLWNEGIDLHRTILKHYVGKNLDLYGIDISTHTTIKAHQQEPTIKTATGSITALPFQNEQFDAILDLSTSDHLPPEEIPVAIREYARCLKPGGGLTLIFDWWGFFWKNYLKYIEIRYTRTDTHFADGKPKRYIHSIPLMKQEIKKYFNIKGEYCIDYTGWTWNRITRPFWESMPRSVYDLLLRLEFSPVSRFLKPLAKQYVIIAIKR